MKTKSWMMLTGINLGIALLVISPFLPGPSNGLVNFIFNWAQVIGPIGLIIVPIGLYWTIKELKKKRKAREYEINWKAVIVLTLPVTIWLSAFYISDFVRDLSRDFAMYRVETLIQSIDKFKTEKGECPDSLNDLTPTFIANIPSPLIMGIEEYYYEKQGDSYNISFVQNVLMGFNFEVVVFDPEDNYKAKEEWANEDGELPDVYETGKKHWRYYVYD